VKVRYSRQAQTDIIEIFDYIAAQNRQSALSVEVSIRDACEKFAEFPYANPATDVTNVFRMPLPRIGFTVFYRVQRSASVIQIARIVRSARVRNLERVPRV
jgi:plasmid stabilization system protein ParE